MKFDWTAPVTDLEGAPIKEGGKVVTVGLLAIRAIDATLPNEQIPTETKLERWDLMLRIRDGGEIDKTELKLVKDRIGNIFAPSIVGACHDLLKDPAPPKAVAKA